MSNSKPGRWTRKPPSGSGPIVTFVFIPSDLSKHQERVRNAWSKEEAAPLNAPKPVRVPPRAAQRVPLPQGVHWWVAGSEQLWPEEQLLAAGAVWWSKTTDIPMLSIDTGGIRASGH